MKKLLFSLVAIVALSLSATAQNVPGLYTFFSGVTLPGATSNIYTNAPGATGYTNVWGAQGTSTNFLISVASCDYAGLTITGAGATTTSNLVTLYKSYDNGATFDATPFSYAQSFTAGTVTTTTASLDVHGMTHLALVMGPVGTGNVTNASIKLFLKAPSSYAFPPANYGKIPGVPITVPSGQTTNGWPL